MSTIKNQLKQHVLSNCLECSLQDLFNNFENEFNHEYNKKRYPNYRQRFAEWLKGLPSYTDIPFYYDDIESLIISFKSDVSKQTLNRYRDYFFEIVADILVNEFRKIKP